MNIKSDMLKNLNKHYKNRKDNELEYIESKNNEYKDTIKRLHERIKYKKEILNGLQEENISYKKRYEELKNTFFNRGMSISIINRGYNIKEWDNLYLKNIYNSTVVCLKDGQQVKLLDEKIAFLLEDILRDKDYSIVVTRVDNKIIRAQLHINS